MDEDGVLFAVKGGKAYVLGPDGAREVPLKLAPRVTDPFVKALTPDELFDLVRDSAAKSAAR